MACRPALLLCISSDPIHHCMSVFTSSPPSHQPAIDPPTHTHTYRYTHPMWDSEATQLKTQMHYYLSEPVHYRLLISSPTLPLFASLTLFLMKVFSLHLQKDLQKYLINNVNVNIWCTSMSNIKLLCLYTLLREPHDVLAAHQRSEELVSSCTNEVRLRLFSCICSR